MGRLLEVAAGHLMGTTAPLLGEAYEQSNVSVLGMLLLAVRHEHERAAARRVAENREWRRMFAGAGAVVGPGGGAGRAEAWCAGPGPPPSLPPCRRALRGRGGRPCDRRYW